MTATLFLYTKKIVCNIQKKIVKKVTTLLTAMVVCVILVLEL